MLGSTARTTRASGLLFPKGYMLHHYEDRAQPYTLLSSYAGHRRGFYRNWAVEGFFETREEALEAAVHEIARREQ